MGFISGLFPGYERVGMLSFKSLLQSAIYVVQPPNAIIIKKHKLQFLLDVWQFDGCNYYLKPLLPIYEYTGMFQYHTEWIILHWEWCNENKVTRFVFLKLCTLLSKF